MQQQDYFRTTAGSTLIPVANATHTLAVPQDFASTVIHVRALDADGVTEVSPSAGTLTFAYQPFGYNLWIAMANPAITATTIKHSALSTYTPPSVTGPAKKVRAILASLAGATFVEIFVVRYNA